MSLTIGETIQQLHHALRDYIEATYHVSDAMLVAQRRRLLEELGVIHQRPYLESTPRYTTGAAFRDLGLDPAALEVFSTASKRKAISACSTTRRTSIRPFPPSSHSSMGEAWLSLQGRALERRSVFSCRSSAGWRARHGPMGKSSGRLRLFGRWSCIR